MTSRQSFGTRVTDLEHDWESNPRWAGVTRSYTAADVVDLQGPTVVAHTLASQGAAKLWDLLANRDYVHALGALSGGQAVQMARAGLEAIYLSGWQVAADGNLAGEVYPDQSLYPANSAPAMVRRINNALMPADQIAWSEGDRESDHLLPIVADAEAGFGGALNSFELAKAFYAAGPQACTSRISWPRRRSADTWAARCSFRRASTSGR
jgi:isocitrate lyase